jgi:soluble lytic murein transglycosylase-like protein
MYQLIEHGSTGYFVAPVLSGWRPRRRARLGSANPNLSAAIVQAAQAQGVPPSLALALAQRESGLNPNAVSSAGAIGVMQLMPSTAAQLGVDPYDANQNIQGGVSYLAQLYQQFGDWWTAAAAYNWGPGNVSKANAAGTDYPSSVQGYANAVVGQSGVGSSSGYLFDAGADGSTSADDSSLLWIAAAGVGVLAFALL